MMKIRVLEREKDVLDRIQNKVVCDVTEYHIKSPMGSVLNWRGSVLEEYFSILFLRGVMTVSVEARECLIGSHCINYGMSEKLIESLEKDSQRHKGKSKLTGFPENDYLKSEAEIEIKAVTFTDIAAALNWKFSPNFKQYVDYFNN